MAWRRRPILCDDAIRNALRDAIHSVRARRPFALDAWVQLPDHIHCIWTLPRDDTDYSQRWREIWEHQIRDQCDFERHADYIHINPVRHGHVSHASLWPYSSFGRYVREGVYPADWGGPVEMPRLQWE